MNAAELDSKILNIESRKSHSILFLGSLLMLPAVLIAVSVAAGEGTMVDTAIRMAFKPFCHQQPDRSFELFGTVFVVCARCTGFYLVLGLAGLSAAVAAHAGLKWHVPDTALWLMLPLALDGTGNLLGLWSTPGTVRAMTGAVAAAPMSLAILGRRDSNV